MTQVENVVAYNKGSGGGAGRRYTRLGLKPDWWDRIIPSSLLEVGRQRRLSAKVIHLGEVITGWLAIEEFSTQVPRCFPTLKSCFLPECSLKMVPYCSPRCFLPEPPEILGLIPRCLPPWKKHCFLSQLHVGSAFGCAELRTEERQEAQGPKLKPPSWWGSPLCNSGAVRLSLGLICLVMAWGADRLLLNPSVETHWRVTVSPEFTTLLGWVDRLGLL